MSKTDFTNILPMQVRWIDADSLGHVNNAQYFSYIESGRVDYCDKVLELQFVPGMKTGWILADIQCSYLQQIHFPQDLEICTRFSKIGNKSATIIAHIYRKGETDPVATSQGIVVWFNYTQQKAERIPDSIRQLIIDYEKSVDIGG
jgi:acyl-CoA thioester hydrolase